MRVIKFRVWDCELKEMIYDAQDESGYESDGFTDFLHQESRYKVMQFTGLLDKSGKEIWEGDVVGSQGSDPGLISWYFNRFVISTAKGLAEIRKIDLNLLEVLGNIYENPELLK